MPLDYLKQLLASVYLEGSPMERPYEKCTITTSRMDPINVAIGQTFIERPKYQAFLENFQESFLDFCVTKGIAKCTALIALGETEDGLLAVAHYLPPIIEKNSVNHELCLLDGMHRNFLVKTVGTTLESIIIEGVQTEFPCELHTWESVSVVQEKPPREKRFFNLKSHLFRDLKAIGIDG